MVTFWGAFLGAIAGILLLGFILIYIDDRDSKK